MFFLRRPGRAALPTLAITLLGLAACAPDLGPAAKITPASDYAASRSFDAPAGAWPKADWWSAYNDSQLTALIERALKGAPDLRVVEARLREADAQLQAAGAQSLPSAGFKGSIEPTGAVLDLPGVPASAKNFLPKTGQPFTQLSANLNYELDFFGKNHAAIAAASSNAKAAQFELEAARLQLSTAVAAAYADLIQARSDLDTAEQASKLRADTRALINDRLTHGLETRAEYSQSDAQVFSSQVDVETARQAADMARHQLAALLGEGPDAELDLAPQAQTAIAPLTLPPSLAIDLVGRRPDVAAARLRAEAAAQREKMARADYYPNLSISAQAIDVALTPQDIFTKNAVFAQFGPALSLPLYDGGRRDSALKGARGEYEEAVASYDKMVVEALKEAADAVSARRSLDASLASARQALNAGEESYRLIRMRYTGQLTPYLNVLTAENGLLAERRQVADLQARALTTDVMLVRALGGGFNSMASAKQPSNP